MTSNHLRIDINNNNNAWNGGGILIYTNDTTISKDDDDEAANWERDDELMIAAVTAVKVHYGASFGMMGITCLILGSDLTQREHPERRTKLRESAMNNIISLRNWFDEIQESPRPDPYSS